MSEIRDIQNKMAKLDRADMAPRPEKASKAKKAEESQEAQSAYPTDKVEISEEAKRLAEDRDIINKFIEEKVQELAQTRRERIEEVKKQIEENRYELDNQNTASNITQDLF